MLCPTVIEKLFIEGGIIIKSNITWDEFHYKMEQIFGKSFKDVDDLYCNVSKEINFGEGVELNDNKVLKYLQNLSIMKGELYVITDFCYYKERGPFVVDADLIEEFVNSFYETYGEDFYSTDIVIVSFQAKRIWVLFHEGRCWLCEGHEAHIAEV